MDLNDFYRPIPWRRLLRRAVWTPLLVLATAACGSNTAPGDKGVSQEPVVLTLNIESPTALVGQTVALTWSAKEAVACTASGAWSGKLAPSGTRRVPVSTAGELKFELQCSNPAHQASARVSTTASAPAMRLQQHFEPRPNTLSTSEGAPYGDVDFWPQVDHVMSNYGYGPTKVYRVWICLSGMVKSEDCSNQPTPTGPLSAEMLAGIDKRLARFAGTGKRLLVRFVYNLGPIGPGARDASATVIATHLDQLAPILLKHQDLVFAFQAGFIGTWGEWHASTSGNTAKPIRNLLIERMLLHFGGHFPILLRYPGQMIEFLGHKTPHPHLGLHDDYFASDATDGGTWAGYNNPSISNGAVLQQFAEEVAHTSMFIGEFGALDPQRQACKTLDAYAHRFQLQSISLGVWPAEIGEALKAAGCALKFMNKVGTRIELREAVVLSPAAQGATTRVELTLSNGGYGRVIRPRPLTLVFSDGATEVARVAVPLDKLDLRGLASGGAASTFAFDLKLGGDLARAVAARKPLTVSAWIPDPAPSLAPQAAYALPFNSLDAGKQDIFQPATGLNRLGVLQPL